MPALDQAIHNHHIDNIIEALESKDVKKALEAFYQFGNMLQIQYPNKDYTAIQKVLVDKEKYRNVTLSDAAATQVGALLELITTYYSDHADTDQSKQEVGDLSLLMTNHALKNAIIFFGNIMPSSYIDQLNRLDESSRKLMTKQSNQVNNWIDKTVSSVALSKKFNLRHLDKLCEVTQKALSNEIGLERIQGFSDTDRKTFPETAIAIDQYKKVSELRARLNGTDFTLSRNLFDFIEDFNKQDTQTLFKKSILGETFNETIKNLMSIVLTKGIHKAYTMWKQHKEIDALQKEFKIQKDPPKLP